MLSRWKSKDKSEKSSKSGSGGKKKRKGRENEEDWQDGTRGDGGLSDGETGRGSGFSRSRGSRREDPRRHTLGGNQHLYISPHHQPPGQHDMEALEKATNLRHAVRALSMAEAGRTTPDDQSDDEPLETTV